MSVLNRGLFTARSRGKPSPPTWPLGMPAGGPLPDRLSRLVSYRLLQDRVTGFEIPS
jgi:hypothetical protein